MVNLKIDGIEVVADPTMTILEASKLVNINIPTLCYHPAQEVKANCRICLVETRPGKLETACSTKVKEGMDIKTNSKYVRENVRGVLELILANHDQDCLKCTRNGNCELQDLCERYNISNNSLESGEIEARETDDSNPSIVRDYSKCIKCNRCVEACSQVQSVNVLSRAYRSTSYEVVPKFDSELGMTECVYCGQCINVCPVGAIYEKGHMDRVLKAIDNPKKHVIVQVAPAVRVSLGEMFGMAPGTAVTNKIVASLRRIGFDMVFDTDFTADLTIMEEGHELLERLSEEGTLPMITSCSPGWINFIEGFYPNLLPHLSTCKSPQQMFGALSKSYYADKINRHPSEIYTVSIMPCTAKKFEAGRDEMSTNGFVDVDAVLTTRELGQLIKFFGIDFPSLPEEAFDDPFGITTGAGAIFGATGGVMEAALRTVYEVVTGETLEKLEFEEIRGMDFVKEGSVTLNGTTVNYLVAHSLTAAREVLENINKGKSKYHFIEIMACPGGCIGGGGQPISLDPDIRKKRISGIYDVDANMKLRKSHENPAVQTLYKEFLGQPLGHKSHELLHTHYAPRFEK